MNIAASLKKRRKNKKAAVRVHDGAADKFTDSAAADEFAEPSEADEFTEAASDGFTKSAADGSRRLRSPEAKMTKTANKNYRDLKRMIKTED